MQSENQKTTSQAPSSKIQLVRALNESRFSIYEACVQGQDEKYALKIFPHIDGKLNPAYHNELNFEQLSHPNIIQIQAKQENFAVQTGDGQLTEASFIMYEFAPYGDFQELSAAYNFGMDEKLCRTYFRQLIEGLDYLHNEMMAHLDLKLENVVLGQDFKLKVIDFDLSANLTDENVKSQGTPHYRPPEMLKGNTSYAEAADIYSAAVVLFTMIYGSLPFHESVDFDGEILVDVLDRNPDMFWNFHQKMREDEADYRQFSKDFKNLFQAMTRKNPMQRATIQQIRDSEWFNGPVYEENELAGVWKKIFSNKTDC